MLQTRQLSVSIGDVTIVEKLDVTIAAGQCWGLIGRNGAGKTTLLNTLAGLRKADSGQIEFQGSKLASIGRRRLARQLGLLQQHTAYVFDATVLQSALIGRHPHLGPWQRESAMDFERARQALRAVDMEQFESRRVTSLSGGEARRLAFATLLVQDPGMLLLDEPTNHLDMHYQIGLMKLLTGLVSESGKAALAALHDVNLVSRYCSHVLCLFGAGEYAAGPVGDLLEPDMLSRLYQHKVSSVDSGFGRQFFPAS